MCHHHFLPGEFEVLSAAVWNYIRTCPLMGVWARKRWDTQFRGSTAFCWCKDEWWDLGGFWHEAEKHKCRVIRSVPVSQVELPAPGKGLLPLLQLIWCERWLYVCWNCLTGYKNCKRKYNLSDSSVLFSQSLMCCESASGEVEDWSPIIAEYVLSPKKFGLLISESNLYLLLA